ncbi:MAG TPA: hypothetical protein VK496_04965 [Gaiellaceae bacterium]|nr:hypothetical protein [Gaiellaceae bacterium]
MTRLLPVTLLALGAIVLAPAAAADRAQEAQLAKRYAPVVRLVSHTDCAPGKPYLPIDVNLLFGEPTVALRGPWTQGDLVKIGPTATDLSKGLFDYHLDFPGSALEPGCDYLRWQRRLVEGQTPAIYGHIATEAGRPGKLALQYWLFYVFNDWNNLHEGDWEMIQLVFDASTAAQALTQPPVEVGYSQHEGAERAAWGDDKLERVDGTHPVVHPAAGSHANFYGESLYLGSSAEQGVGCDDTRGPTFDIRPTVQTIPSDPAQARADFPWIAFEGRWGELRPAFFNGPTGPNLKTQWTEPIRWSEGWRARSYTVPGGSAFGTAGTDFFCGSIAHGSRALVRLVDNPVAFGLVLAGLALLVITLISRATWRPTAPLRLAHRRSWGQILSASVRMYVKRIPLFVGIGLVVIPISLLVTLLQALTLHATSILGVQTGGEDSGLLALFVLAIGTALTLLGLGLVQAACARALVRIDEGRPVGPLAAYRLAVDSAAPLFGAVLVASIVVSLLASSIFLIPIAVWLAGRWALIAPAVELESLSAARALRRSGRLVRRRWLKVASLIVAGGALVVVAGPLIGVLLILVTDAPFWLVNLIAGIVYAVAMPLVALVTAYVYFDARTRGELEAESELTELPAEIELST